MIHKILIFFTFLTLNVMAQPAIEWQKCFGGSESETFGDMAKTNNGGFILVGTTWSNNGDVSGVHNSGDGWIVKVDSFGSIEWEKSLGGSEYDIFNCVIPLENEGYLLAGSSESNDGDVSGHHGTPGYKKDFWVVKLDSLANIIWQKSYGGTGSERLKSIIETIDNGYMLVGESDSEDGDISDYNGGLWVVKIDSVGGLEWEKSYGSGSAEGAVSVVQDSSGNYIYLGYQNEDYYVIKTNSTGAILWEKHYGGSYLEQPSEIIKSHDSGFLIVGDSKSTDEDITGNESGQDIWVIKIDSSGNLLWQNSFGGSNGDNGYSITQTSDGGYAVTGQSSSDDEDLIENLGYYDFWTIKIDSIGQLIWQISFGGSEGERGKCIIPLDDGKLILAGETDSQNGDVINNHGKRDFWLIKIDGFQNFDVAEINNQKFNLYPNPTEGLVNLQMNQSGNVNLIITNSHGQVLYDNKTFNSSDKIDLTNYTKGYYFITITSELFNKTEVIIKL